MTRPTAALIGLTLTVAGCVDAADAGLGGTDVTSSGAATVPASTAASGSSTGTTGTVEPEGSTSAQTETSTGTAAETSTGGQAPDACDELDTLVESLQGTDPDDMPALVDAFVREAQYGPRGLPLRCGDDVVFISTTAGFVAGDFNGWDPRGLALQAPIEDAPLWIARAEITAPGGLYKQLDAGEFRADPLARRYGWDEFGEYSLVDPDPRRGHHERWPDFSEAVAPLQPRTVRVYVPAAANAGEEVPVLYMHDGQNVFSPDALFGGWQASSTASALIDEGRIAPVLIVAIDNTPARLEEYSHVEDDLGEGPIGGMADDYADFVVEGVLPFVEDRYDARPGRENTAVLGSSMGGLVSLHIGHRHPDVFGYVGSMSGTLAWGTFGLDNETMIDRYAHTAPELVVYVDSGGNGPCPGDGSDNYCENVDFAGVLRSRGWEDDVDLIYRWIPSAPHNEAAWAARLPGALLEWFPAAPSSQ